MVNPPTFYRSKVYEDLEEFIDDVYKLIYAMGVSSIEKAELATYKTKDVLKHGMRIGGIRGL